MNTSKFRKVSWPNKYGVGLSIFLHPDAEKIARDCMLPCLMDAETLRVQTRVRVIGNKLCLLPGVPNGDDETLTADCALNLLLALEGCNV